MDRVLQPTVLQTKQELLVALQQGQITSSKYNLLNDGEKRFVELVVFAGYTGDQAIRLMDPSNRHPGIAANKMLANQLVAETLEELTVQKDAKFMAEIVNARDMALAKLKYIMSTSKDEALQAATAKTILDKTEKIMQKKDSDEEVGRVQFNIQVEHMHVGGSNPVEDVIIPLDEDEIIDAEAEFVNSKQEKSEAKPPKAPDVRRDQLKENRKKKELPINPDTGLPYTLAYEAVDAYKKED